MKSRNTIQSTPLNKTNRSQLSESYFLELDNYLDEVSNGPYHLGNPKIAQIVYDSIIYRDTKCYKLVCFCIMSNHVHMIIYKL